MRRFVLVWLCCTIGGILLAAAIMGGLESYLDIQPTQIPAAEDMTDLEKCLAVVIALVINTPLWLLVVVLFLKPRPKRR